MSPRGLPETDMSRAFGASCDVASPPAEPLSISRRSYSSAARTQALQRPSGRCLFKAQGHPRAQSKASCLVERFLPFSRGTGVGNNSRACGEGGFSILKNCRANRDGELTFSVVAKIADGARVDSARMRFQLGDDFEGALFRGAGDRTTRKASVKGRRVRDILAERSGHRRDEVVDLLIAFVLQELGNGDT